MLVQLDTTKLPFADNSIDLIFTDPPYPKEYLPCYEWLAIEATRVLKPNGFVLVMAGGLYLDEIFYYFRMSGLSFFWEFHHLSNKQAPYIWQRKVIAKSKVILAYTKGNGMPRVGGVQSIYQSTGKMKAFHHWGQDVASARYYIDYFSKENDLILDPFAGGGTTKIACDLINRRCISGDIDSSALLTIFERVNNPNTAAYINMPLFQKEAK